MFPTQEQLKCILVPYKQSVVLSVSFDSNRAKCLLENYADISSNFSKDDKGHLAKSQLESIVKYGKTDGTKLTYNNDKKVSNGWGRLYCKNACAYVSITRQLRYYLAYDRYSDHDIVNCHPVIAQQLLGTFNINAKALVDWNTNRDAYYDTMISKSTHSISRDDCKKIGFCFLYGGDVARKFNALGLPWNSDSSIQAIYEVAQGVSRSMHVLQNAVSQTYPAVWHELPFNAAKEKPDWGKFSSFMQHIERHLVLKMFKMAQNSGYQVGDIAHDGLFLAQDGAPVLDCKEYYRACIDDIQQDTGFVIELSGKPMQCPEWASSLSYKKDDELLEYTDEYDAALHVLKRYDTILYHKDAAVHVVHENVYKKSPIASSEVYLHSLINGIEYKEKDNHNRVTAEKISKNIRDIVLGDTSKEINTVEEFNKNICLFPFINGVYDIRTNAFRPYRPNEVFLQKISKVYNSALIDEQVSSKLKDVVFNVFEDGCQEYFFQLLSRAMAGHFRDKSWAMFVGSRNSGKGTMVCCLELLKELIAHISPPIETLDTDIAKMYGSYMNAGCGAARLAITNEIKDNPNKPVKGSSEIIKNLVSGGDVISARLLNRNAVDFVCTSSIFWFLNKMPDFTDTAVLNNCSLFNMPHVFDDEAVKTLASKAADVNIKSWITETPGVMESFLDILHKHYLPKPPKRIVQCNTSQYKQDNVTKFLNAYTLDPDGWVLCTDVQALLPDINATQVGKFISKHWGDKIQRTQKYFKELVDGTLTSVSKRGYQGISLTPTLDDMNC